MSETKGKNPYPVTPDGRYFVVKGQLWRCTNPHLPEDERQRWVQQLMAARRRIQQAQKAQSEAALQAARQQVHEAKVALGERGPVWWEDDAPDYNRHQVQNTPYADWYQSLPTHNSLGS